MDLVGESPVYCSAAVTGIMFLNLYPGDHAWSQMLLSEVEVSFLLETKY
jgi:hypothetical protein